MPNHNIPTATSVGVAQRGWSGQICNSQTVSFLSFFFCFLHHAPRSHFLTDRDELCAKTHISGQVCAFWGSQQYPITFRGLNPQKTFPKWAGIGISQPNRQSRKIANKDIHVKFHRQIEQRGHYRKNAKLDQKDREGSHVTYL